ncbi:uridine kinase [Thiomonas sp. X19]|uniref:uridine kinase family protein n=1 Tax=Thiomonas sp. X19 TaxID=1050370 RepID=UPI00131477E5|nr:AAA family ATPase [Thiomonas sp. X19]
MALDGCSGVGKSTLARRLASLLDAVVIEGDDFYAGGVHLRDDTPAERVGACLDWRRQREVLINLHEGQVARHHAFDWDAFDGSLCAAEALIAPAPVVILEGVYSARPELSDLVDLRVFVNLNDVVRLRRLQARDGGIGAWEQQWIDAEAHYFEHVLAGLPFDLIITGDESGDAASERSASTR